MKFELDIALTIYCLALIAALSWLLFVYVGIKHEYNFSCSNGCEIMQVKPLEPMDIAE